MFIEVLFCYYYYYYYSNCSYNSNIGFSIKMKEYVYRDIKTPKLCEQGRDETLTDDVFSVSLIALSAVP